MLNDEEFVWSEKYRPRRISDTVLPVDLKKVFQTFVDQSNVPNLLLTGTAGVGKTTVARAMFDEMGCDNYVVNGSLHGNIDTLRNEIMSFASTVSLTGGRKYVIIDEADYLNPQSTQPALRGFMQDFSRNCGFVLTCNFRNRIIEPLQSRCSVVEFKVGKADRPRLAVEFMRRLEGILAAEGVEYDKAVLAELITVHFPDFRRIINECQRYSAGGKIDVGILRSVSDENTKVLVGYLKDKNFTAMRKWVADSSDVEPVKVMRAIYDGSTDLVAAGSIPQLVLILAEYQYKAAFVADSELNLVACLTQLMVELQFK